jgi:hypothetical protein
MDGIEDQVSRGVFSTQSSVLSWQEEVPCRGGTRGSSLFKSGQLAVLSLQLAVLSRQFFNRMKLL